MNLSEAAVTVSAHPITPVTMGVAIVFLVVLGLVRVLTRKKG